jgi:hypothetical protein
MTKCIKEGCYLPEGHSAHKPSWECKIKRGGCPKPEVHHTFTSRMIQWEPNQKIDWEDEYHKLLTNLLKTGKLPPGTYRATRTIEL